MRETYYLNPKEYGKICSEINQIYEARYKDKHIAAHPSFGINGVAYIYWFENFGFNNYNFFAKFVDNH